MGVNPTARAAARTSVEHSRVHQRIGHQPAAFDVLASGLELRLDECDDVGHSAPGAAARRAGSAGGR